MKTSHVKRGAKSKHFSRGRYILYYDEKCVSIDHLITNHALADKNQYVSTLVSSQQILDCGDIR